VAWKAVAALIAVIAGAVGGFAIYTFGWRDEREPRDAFTLNARGQRVYVLSDGDVVVRREAATQCEASGEGGRPNLFCTRIRDGKHQIIFYRHTVLVWPLDRGPDGPPFTFDWQP
jgi:hypothetical protein